MTSKLLVFMITIRHKLEGNEKKEQSERNGKNELLPVSWLDTLTAEIGEAESNTHLHLCSVKTIGRGENTEITKEHKEGTHTNRRGTLFATWS